VSVSETFIKEFDIGVGDDVLMLGRFINRDGIQRNAPTARFGHISQMLGDPIENEVGGRVYPQQAILCEVRSIGGYSGSPVLLLPSGPFGRAKRIPHDKGYVLGIDFCHVQSWSSPLDDRGNELGHIRIPSNTGMAGVIPAWKLEALLDSERAREGRTKSEEQERRRRSEALEAL
jgi:hypothetical protein